MKTKKDFPFLTLFIVAAVSIVIFLPLRVYQYFEVLEPETGFYIKKDFSVYFMYAVMLIVCGLSVVLSFINRKALNTSAQMPEKTGVAVYLVAAIGFIIDGAQKAMQFVDVYENYVYNFQQSLMQYLSDSGGMIFVIQAALSVISSLYFFALAIGGITKKDNASSLKIIALAPSLWAAMRLLFRFKSTISFTNVSDLLLELFAIVFMMMFFFAFAQTTSHVDKGENYWKIFAYGIPTAVLSIACFVPRAVLSVVGHSDLIADGYSPEVCDFTVAIMILAVLISKVTVSVSSKKS